MKKNINVVCVNNCGFGFVCRSIKNIENDLNTFYEIIGCDYVDILSRKINGKYYDFIVDDEFLLKNQPTQYDCPTMTCSNADEVIWGTIIIVKHNANGDIIGLNKDDINRIIKRENELTYEI